MPWWSIGKHRWILIEKSWVQFLLPLKLPDPRGIYGPQCAPLGQNSFIFFLTKILSN